MERQLVLAGGTIRTLDRSAPVVDRLAVGGGRIAAGRDPAAKQVNLGGACVLPGLNDSHVHFPTWSLARRQVRLEDARTRSEALDRVGLALGGLPRGAWL